MDDVTKMITPTVSKIMIIRHAEKPTGDFQGINDLGVQDPESLIVRGWQRSGGLINLFDSARGPLQSAELAKPGTIIASWTSATKGSQRPLQTVAALAQELGLTPTTFDKKDIHPAVDAALTATGTVLISWQHEDIQAIAERVATKSGLPVTPTPPSTWPPPSWPGDRFDLVWVFDVVGSGPSMSWNFTQVPQLLLPGDLSSVVTASMS